MMLSSRKIMVAKESSLVVTFSFTATVLVVETSNHQEGCRCRLVSPGRLQAACSAYNLCNPIYSHCCIFIILFHSQWLYTAPYRGSGCTLHLHLHIHMYMYMHMHLHMHMQMHMHMHKCH